MAKIICLQEFILFPLQSLLLSEVSVKKFFPIASQVHYNQPSKSLDLYNFVALWSQN